MGVVVVFYLPRVEIRVEHQCRRLQGLFNLNPRLRLSLTLNHARKL
jgi:hypothetical protein